MKNYWFSFSYKGKNNGVCVVQADCKDSALEKTINLGIHPAHDDIYSTEIESLEEGMEYNILYSTEEMKQLGYNSVKLIKKQ